MTDITHLSSDELEQGLDHILQSPKDEGVLELIVRRPDVDQRETLEAGRLDAEEGLVGDNWLARGSRHTADGSADPDMQLNIMNTRVVGLVAVDPDRRELAGDQLYIDMDLSPENSAARYTPCVGRGHHRGHRATTYRVQKVCSTFRQ